MFKMEGDLNWALNCTKIPKIFEHLYKHAEFLFQFVMKYLPQSVSLQNSLTDFLRNTIIAYSTENCHDFENVCRISFHELVDRAKQIIYQNNGYYWKANQLTLNEKEDNLYVSNWNLQDMLQHENLAFVNSEHFKELHKLLGDEFIIYLLTKCSLFELIKEGSFIQRTGISTQTLVKTNTNKHNTFLKINNKQDATVQERNQNSLCISKLVDNENLPSSTEKEVKITRKRENDSVQFVQPLQKKQKISPMLPKTKMKRHKKARRGKRCHKQACRPPDVISTNDAVLALMKQINFSFNCEILRSRIFYCKQFREKFPEKNCLSYLVEIDKSVDLILCTIFSVKENQLKDILTEEQYSILSDQLKVITECHRSCFFKSLLQHHCPMNLKQKYINIPLLLECHSSEKEVIRFIRAVLCHVVPSSFLSTNKNYRKFLKKIELLVKTGKNDILRLSNFMKGMKIKDSVWLKSLKHRKVSSFLFAKILLWVINYTLCILQGYFYITESGIHKKKLFFYRKPVWQKIQTICLNEFLRQKNLIPVPSTTVKGMCSEGKCLGIAKVRFLAKHSSVRPILSLPKKNNMRFSNEYRLIHNLTCVFEYIKKQQSSLFGCAKETSMDVYQAWKKFVTYHKEKCKNSKLYFVKVDLQDCFGSMKQNKLLQIAKQMLQKYGGSCYRIRKYCVIYEDKNLFKMQFLRRASPISEMLLEYVQKEEKPRRNSIIVDMGTDEFISEQKQLDILEAYISNCILKVGKLHYRLAEGICQGGLLSTFLCNLYLTALENDCLRDLQNHPEELLMRMIDDFIFITPRIDRAEYFVKIMLTGLTDYNLKINPEKIIANFSTEVHSAMLLKKEELPWLGLFIDTNTLNIAVDYTRYAGLSIGYSMSIDDKNSGMGLKKKMLALIVLRFLPIILDTQINEENISVKNLIEYFLLLAYRMHHMILRWSPKQRMQNPRFLLDIIMQCANLLFYKCNTLVKQNIMDFSLTKLNVQWICLQAFSIKFKKHYGMYEPLLSKMKQIYALNQKMDKKKLQKWKEILRGYPDDTFQLIFD